jgi:hypothetical protein
MGGRSACLDKKRRDHDLDWNLFETGCPRRREAIKRFFGSEDSHSLHPSLTSRCAPMATLLCQNRHLIPFFACEKKPY